MRSGPSLLGDDGSASVIGCAGTLNAELPVAGVNVIGAGPGLLMVTFWVADDFTATLPKSSVAGVAVRVGVKPVPLSATEAGPKVALDWTAPVVVGVKVTAMVVEALGASVIG